ncbi:MAG: Gmad2 immunoglobulin-like domain-containing protein [Anaerolineae bacterium]|nr:Gmad2 immunoglobulin-like domain-containing protein [Anaerolineae bacterium]
MIAGRAVLRSGHAAPCARPGFAVTLVTGGNLAYNRHSSTIRPAVDRRRSAGARQDTPAISITSPADGATVNTDSGSVTVTGTAANVFEGNVVVRVIDAGGAQLAEQPTTADVGGNWSVTLAVGAVDTAATIRAYATSPDDGSVVAEATVNVTFVTTPPAQAEITITTPQDGATIQHRQRQRGRVGNGGERL